MPLTPKGQIDRTGVISFHDASISIWEDSIPSPSGEGGFKARDAWEREFKRQVFARVIQTLHRLGWTVAPWDSEHYRLLAPRRRTCRKGDLHGELSIDGRVVEFKMWQDVTPSENPNGGRHDFDKLIRMPYVLRLEVERTRRRISEYLCNVFSGYSVKQKKIDSPNPDPLAWFNDKWDDEYEKKRGTHRFKRGADGWPSEEELNSWDRKDADGLVLNHGDVRWLRNHKGHLLRGRVYGGINGRWTLVYGPGERDYTCAQAGEFFTYKPDMTPAKSPDPRQRRKRLEQELKKAVAAMDFKRAQLLKSALFPEGPLYAIWSKEKRVYFDIMYCGYRESIADAGKYTRDELRPYLGDKLETDQYKAVPITEAA